MPNRRVYFDVMEAADLYADGYSLNELGQKYGCCAQTILNRMREANIDRRSISEALKGRPVTWGNKIGNALKGRTMSQSARANLSSACIGRIPHNKGKRKATHPEEVQWGMSGVDHWNWKGGISSESGRIRQSSEYKAWRDAVFKRDNWTCVLCGKRGGKLEADHIKRFSTHSELRFDVSNGRTLCKEPCHRNVTIQQRRSKNEQAN